ncbi:MAG TPA: DUF4261 domain-containing protein, partial [Novosphingobium sp.]|nr:DUF4261 domain-containing protein [Novosphingobium sp.]
AKVQEGLDVIDPEGRWQVRASGAATGTVHGRGCTLGIDFSAVPMPAYLPELALWRSFWVRSGEPLRALRRHGAYVTIGCDLDCEAAEFVDIRQSAKAMCLALAVIAKFGPCVGVMNAAQNCVYTEDQLDMLVGPLGSDEVSIKLFLWTAFHSTSDDAVSLSTAGLLPFVGREVECWNAPGTLDFVGNKLNGVLRYLLINGPVIRNGDTIGEVEGDRSIRIYHGESDDRSARPHSVPVLYMEFEGPGGASAPRPDPAVPALDADPQIQLMLEALRADASPQSRAMLDELEELIANPPPREVIESDANPIARLLMRWIALEQGEGKLPGGQDGPWQPPLDSVGALALIALTQGIGYPREQLEEMLGEAFPTYTWKAEEGPGGLNNPKAVLGQMPGRTIGVWIEARKEALPAAIAAPPHRVHVRVAVDAGRDAALARRVALVVASTLFLFQDKAGHVQLGPDGNWLAHDDALTGVILPRHTTDISGFEQASGIPVVKLRGGNWMDGAAPPSNDRLEEVYFAQAPAAAPSPPVQPAAPGALGFGRRAAGGGFGRKGL